MKILSFDLCPLILACCLSLSPSAGQRGNAAHSEAGSEPHKVGCRTLSYMRQRFVNSGAGATGCDAGPPAAAPTAEPARQRYEFVAPQMGTLWRLVFFSAEEKPAHEARDAVWRLIAEIDAALSDYRETSEVNRLCRAGRIDRASEPLREVLERSLDISRQTDGAFDPTVGPLVRLWRESRQSRRRPADEAITRALNSVGWTAVRVTRAANGETGFELLKPGMQLDFGAIGKGYAQDRALRELTARGFSRALIDAGGGILAGDPPPGTTAWRVEVPPPDEAGEAITVSLKNGSLATSGDAHQFVEIDGVRYSHIVDPRTGLGLTERIQASVIAKEAATADALATAFCVMGEEKTRTFLKAHPGIDVRLVTQRGGRLRIWESKGFDRVVR
jgi:thiamine biosynthesis lipoprotein